MVLILPAAGRCNTSFLSENMKKRITQPVYRQIADDLRDQIQSEDWGPGFMLPSRSDLAREYGVAIMTVQKAVQLLLDEGLLVARPRSGTFVAPKTHDLGDASPKEGEVSAKKKNIAVTASPGSIRPVIGVIGSFFDPNDTDQKGGGGVWAASIIRGFSVEIDALNGRAEVFNLRGAPADEDAPIAEAIKKAIKADAQCLVFVDEFGFGRFDRRIPPLVERLDLPYVVISASTPAGQMPKICIDECQAGRAAVSHLLEAGYSKIIALPLYDFHWEKMRIEGARQVAGEALSLPKAADIDLLRPAYGSWTMQGQPERAELHAEIIDRMIGFNSLEPGKWAVLMPNDPTAVPLHEVLRQRGLTPGPDIGLIGFDDHAYASLHGITSVGQPLHQIGVTAARLLYEAVRSDLESVQAVVRCHVVERASTQRQS